MIVLQKKVETYTIDTLANAEMFVEEVKRDPDSEGYELKSYKIAKKEKKQKGIVVEEFYIVEIQKVWNE